MNKTLNEAVELASSVRDLVANNTDVDVVLCPPFTNLYAVYQVIKDTPVKLGAQNLFWEDNGAYTAEVAADMLKSVGRERKPALYPGSAAGSPG